MQTKQVWDVQLFRKTVPKLVAQLYLIDSTFQNLISTLSQFNDRLSSIVLEQPYNFSMLLPQRLYNKINNIAEDIQNHNKCQMKELADIVKAFKAGLYELTQNYQDCGESTKHAEGVVRVLDDQIQKAKKSQQEMQIRTNIHTCKYYNKDGFNKIFEDEDAIREQYLANRIAILHKQSSQAYSHLQSACNQQSQTIKKCLDKINACSDRILKYKQSPQKFETFNRNQHHNETFNRNQDHNETFNRNQDHNETFNRNQHHQRNNSYVKASSLSKQQDHKIGQFSESQSLYRVIEQAEINCENRAYPRIEKINSRRILEAAILAESKDQFHEQELQRYRQ